MIFDDHDVIDDWNISWDWVEDARSEAWWDDRITGAFMSYWIYQHLGQPGAAGARRGAPVRPRAPPASDIGEPLQQFAEHADRESAASRWAYFRDFGRSRVLVVDSRAARVLADGRRDMVDDEEWEWIIEHSRGAVRSPRDRQLDAGLPLARGALPGGVERGGLRRGLGRARRTSGREAASRARPRALARLPAVVRADDAAARATRRMAPTDTTPRPRSPWSAATCTTPTSPRYRWDGSRGAAAASTRSSARPSGIRSARRSGAWSP